MSYSSPYGMPPTLARAAAIFRKQNRERPKSGLQLNGRPPEEPRLILDPEPTDPFERLWLYLAIVWTGALLPLALLLLTRFTRPFRNWSGGGLGAVGGFLTMVLILVLVAYGRVSWPSSIAIKIGIITGIALGCLDTVKCFRTKRWIQGIGLAIAFGAIGLFVFPLLLYP